MSILGTRSVNSLVKPNYNKKNGWIFGVTVAISVSFALKWWLYNVVLGKQRKSLRMRSADDPDHINDKKFEETAATMRESNIKLSTAEKLQLYGLYKQATIGDAPLISLSLFVADQAKHHAWGQYRGVKREVAAQLYVEQATELLRTADEGGRGNASRSTDFGAGVTSRPMEEQAMDKASMSPLQLFMQAAIEDDVDAIITMLESKRVQVDEIDDGGQTALHLAADSGSLRAAKVLLQHGGNVLAADHYGISVLQAAVIAGKIDVCKLLLEHGADPDQADHDGDTPRHCAEDDGSPEICSLLRVAGSGSGIESANDA